MKFSENFKNNLKIKNKISCFSGQEVLWLTLYQDGKFVERLTPVLIPTYNIWTNIGNNI